MKNLNFAVALFCGASLLLLGATHARASDDVPRPLTKEQRISRNKALVNIFYKAYVDLPRLGYADAWKAADYATPYIVNGKTIDHPEDWKERDKYEYTVILDVLPDYQPDKPPVAFCNEDGCAFLMVVSGHDSDGKVWRFDEVIFLSTNKYGKITRYDGIAGTETYSFITRVTGLSEKELRETGFAAYQTALRDLYAKIQERKKLGK